MSTEKNSFQIPANFCYLEKPIKNEILKAAKIAFAQDAVITIFVDGTLKIFEDYDTLIKFLNHYWSELEKERRENEKRISKIVQNEKRPKSSGAKNLFLKDLP